MTKKTKNPLIALAKANAQLAEDIAETQNPNIRFVNEHPDYRGLVKQGIKGPARHAPSMGG